MLGELRSMLPDRVKIIATTATATAETFHIVKQQLSMPNPAIVAIPPGRGNIKYTVHANPKFSKMLSELIEELTVKRTALPKTLIFCRELMQCATM